VSSRAQFCVDGERLPLLFDLAGPSGGGTGEYTAVLIVIGAIKRGISPPC
jgi:hypothetical protein